MTTAREQTRKAVSAHWHGSSLTRHPQQMADAASDVWEPIVKDLLRVVHLLCTKDEFTEEEDDLLDDTYARAKEALGD